MEITFREIVRNTFREADKNAGPQGTEVCRLRVCNKTPDRVTADFMLFYKDATYKECVDAAHEMVRKRMVSVWGEGAGAYGRGDIVLVIDNPELEAEAVRVRRPKPQRMG